MNEFIHSHYLFFSEVIHFRGVLIGEPYFLVQFVLIIAAGIFFRFMITNKQSFGRISTGALAVWLIGELIVSYVLKNDLLNLLFLSLPFSNMNWLIITFIFSALITHPILRIAKKRPLV